MTNMNTPSVMSDRDPLVKKESAFEGGIYKGLIQPCLAEFVTVTLFVFLGSLSFHHSNTFVIGITHGFALSSFVCIAAPISGGHLNPAVTLAVFLSGGISCLKAICYVVVQLLGGILGAAFTKGVLNKSDYEAIHGGAHMLPDDTAVGQGILCEALITTILVLTVLMTAVDDEYKSPFAPLVIGLAMVVGIFGAGSVTGASMNPARSFGPALVDSSLQDSQWDYHHVYWIGPFIGSVSATFIYKFMLAGPTKNIFGC